MHFELNDDFAQENGLICGGQMDVHVDPLEPAPRLYIIGAGHVGWHLARLADEIDFRVHVVDDREKFANRERFPGRARKSSSSRSPSGCIVPTSPPRRTSSSSRADTRAISKRCARWPPRDLKYLGLIGSRAKVARIRSALVEEGMPPECLDRVHSPIGLDIGAVTPAEIAVAHPRRADRRPPRRRPARAGSGRES